MAVSAGGLEPPAVMIRAYVQVRSQFQLECVPQCSSRYVIAISQVQLSQPTSYLSNSCTGSHPTGGLRRCCLQSRGPINSARSRYAFLSYGVRTLTEVACGIGQADHQKCPEQTGDQVVMTPGPAGVHTCVSRHY